MRNIGKLPAIAVAAALAFFGSGEVMAKQDDRSKDQNAEVAKIITDLDHQWLGHARTRQIQYLQELFTDDFVEILDGGQILTKAQLIKSIEASNTQVDVLDADQIQVSQVSPNLAILTDRTTIKGRFNGKDVTAQYRVFRIFMKQQDKWRAAGAALTRLQSGI
jgi:ketosteroid isomerase-like protein